jgi:hypothetical protein
MTDNEHTMTDKNELVTHRGLIKGAGLIGGAALLAEGAHFSASEAEAATVPVDELLSGVFDLHVHGDPDVRPRCADELNMSRKAKQMGYRGVMFKCHDFITHDRACHLRSVVPGLEIFGGLTLNKTHGDSVNVYAAEMALKVSGGYCRSIWMPTYQSRFDYEHDKKPGKGIPVLDEAGKVLPEVVKVMELCGKANIIFATGHCAPAESVILAKKAKEVGIPKCVITHCTQEPWFISLDRAKECLAAGAYLEHCVLPFFSQDDTPAYAASARERPRITMKQIVEYIKLDPSRSFIVTDLGQQRNPHPVDGMRFFIESLLANGLTREEIDTVAKKVPAMLMNLED